MLRFTRIGSCLIILLGLMHLGFAFPLQLNTYTLWFVGSGMAIIFAGLLNLVGVENGGTRFTKIVATFTNAAVSAMFAFALVILNQPHVYVGSLCFC